MILEPEFSFDQEVWLYHQGLPVSGRVAAVTICPRRCVYRIEHKQWGKESFLSVDADGLFASREDLANGLREQADQLVGVQ